MPAFYKFMIYKYLLNPKSIGEDKSRRELILNILLLFTLGLLFIATLAKAIFDGFHLHPAPGTMSIYILFVIDMFFASLYFFSRKGFATCVAYVFVLLYFFLATYMAYLWGVEAQSPLIFFILVIFLSGILINSFFAFVMTLLSSSVLYLFYYWQTQQIFSPDMSWKAPWQWKEVIVVTVIFGLIAMVSWLSNRETEKSLRRARRSEGELKKERDMLEIRVQERTEELKRVQLEKSSQIHRFAEFGRLSSGFFHDLINPLTIMSLNMERVKDEQIKEVGEAKLYLSKAIGAAKRLEDFIITARKQVMQQENLHFFSLSSEIKNVIEMLSYKAKKAKVILQYHGEKSLEIFGDSVKFSQAMTNLIANAIDAYHLSHDEKSLNNHEVKISSYKKDQLVYVEVEDHGEGIEKENLEKIFEPFFSTKNDQGMGIGLSLTRDIIEKSFKGKIRVESKRGQGAKFIVELPLVSEDKNNL